MERNRGEGGGSIAAAESALQDIGQQPSIMIDCSHANSNKDHRRQVEVLNSVATQIQEGNSSITGVMIESNLVAGNQKIGSPEQLTYGQSITDACVDWQDTQDMLRYLNTSLKNRAA